MLTLPSPPTVKRLRRVGCHLTLHTSEKIVDDGAEEDGSMYDVIAKDLILVPSVSLLCCFPRSGEGDSCEMFHMLLSNLDKVE